MVGITSYGAYVPLWRLGREAIMKGLRGEKAIRNFDEDSTTMAVAAAIDCLKGQKREAIDAVFFASTTAPYKEKQIATTIAAACDLRHDITTADFTNSLRSATSAIKTALDAIKAGSAKEVLVVAADCRMGAPGTEFEQIYGDGAAAVLIGEKDPIASIDAWHSISNEAHDYWRLDGDTFVRSWEDRFIFNAVYYDLVAQNVAALLKKVNLTTKDFAKAIIPVPSPRALADIPKKLGIDPKAQLQNPLLDNMGNTGAAYALMLLVAALEEAKAGDKVLLNNYGNGSDSLAITVTDKIGKKVEGRRGMKAHLASKKMVDDYRVYLQWRELLTFEATPTPPGGHISAAALYRDRSQIYPLHGLKCKSCGEVHFPPQRVCPKCKAKDQFQEWRLSDRKGKLFTFAADYLCQRREAPRVTAIIDFDGGGRMATMMTDRVLEEIKIGMPVEMSFRKLVTQDGFHNYFWKSIPIRS
jgi:3-hydroxy-3-methylglutaryl CoA synthase